VNQEIALGQLYKRGNEICHKEELLKTIFRDFLERLIDSVTAIQTEIFPEIKINMNSEIKQKILTSND
jgi:hypothetical protein